MFISLPVCPLSGRKNNKIEFFYRFYYRFAVTAVVILVELVFEGRVDLFACLLKKDDCMWVEAC